MNAKIFLPELIDLLSRKNGCPKKEAEQFLKEFFSLATQTVSQGENLKINGLGQFRLVWVEPRASVNVHTGEPMEIPGHYKLSYVPDKAMRDAVNAPFSGFIPEVLPDDAPMVEKPVPSPESDDDEAKVEDPAAPVSEETITSEAQVSEESVEEKPEEVTPSAETASVQETQATEEKEEEYEYEETFTEKMRNHPFVTTLCVLVLLVVLVGGGALWQAYRQGISPKDAWHYYFPSTSALVEATPDSSADETPLAEEEVQAEEEIDVQALPPLAVRRLAAGSRLTLLALEYYGDKDFWVYIYEENKVKMPNPNRLPVGMEVKIPDARKYGIDVHNEESLSRARELAKRLKLKFE